ncbi:MAG: hypothetical protein ACP5QA_14060 [Phycisphaerae bacterium]
MNTRKSLSTVASLLAVAAVSGMMAGTTQAASANVGVLATSSVSNAVQTGLAGTAASPMADMAWGVHTCKGMNACKGQGGCKTATHSCVGKNSCKGKGGCNTTAPKNPMATGGQ